MKEIIYLFIIIELGFLIGAIGMNKGSRSVSSEIKWNRWKKYISYFLIVHIMISSIMLNKLLFVLILSTILLVSSIEIIYVSFRYMRFLFLKRIIAIITLSLFIILISGSIFFSFYLNKNIILYIYIIIAVLDAYSQITGQIIGKHKLAPKISPNKTIEGAIGGIFCSLVTGIILHNLINASIIQSLILSIIISCFGIIGDLASSLYKRQCNIKDYSNFLPGQGGMLDRFNSFLFSLFAIGCIFYLIDKYF